MGFTIEVSLCEVLLRYEVQEQTWHAVVTVIITLSNEKLSSASYLCRAGCGTGL